MIPWNIARVATGSTAEMREPKAKLSTKFSLYTISASPSRYTPVNNVNRFTQDTVHDCHWGGTVTYRKSERLSLFLIYDSDSFRPLSLFLFRTWSDPELLQVAKFVPGNYHCRQRTLNMICACTQHVMTVRQFEVRTHVLAVPNRTMALQIVPLPSVFKGRLLIKAL